MVVGLVIFACYLGISLWASVRVSERVADRAHRYAYFLLIWLLPLFGAFAAMFLTSISAARKRPVNAHERMFDAVVDARRDSKK